MMHERLQALIDVRQGLQQTEHNVRSQIATNVETLGDLDLARFRGMVQAYSSLRADLTREIEALGAQVAKDEAGVGPKIPTDAKGNSAKGRDKPHLVGDETPAQG